MKDFDAWNKVKQNTHVLQTLRYLKEEEIWWCKLCLNIGDEQDGKGRRFERPVVIIKKFNRNLFWSLPLSSVFKKYNKYYITIFLSDGRTRSCVISQIRMIDSKRLSEKMAKVTSLSFEQIKKEVRNLL